MTSLPPEHHKDAIELYKVGAFLSHNGSFMNGLWFESALLFSETPMQGSALQYHIDLAQTVLAKAVATPVLQVIPSLGLDACSTGGLQDELVCQLIRLSHSGIGGTQSWQLLALALSLFLPATYTALSLLRFHLARVATAAGDGKGRLAAYCQRAAARTRTAGKRKEGPSRLEALSLLSRDPAEHAQPHSLPVRLPDGATAIVAFDGSSGVGEVADELAASLGLRQPLHSGYALHADHPLQPDLAMPLNPRQKVAVFRLAW